MTTRVAGGAALSESQRAQRARPLGPVNSSARSRQSSILLNGAYPAERLEHSLGSSFSRGRHHIKHAVISIRAHAEPRPPWVRHCSTPLWISAIHTALRRITQFATTNS